MVIVASLWLGWQVVREVAVQRLPVVQAVRLSPTSPALLAKAADEELQAKRLDNAKSLARESLTRAPFNQRALRVLGMSEVYSGNPDQGESLVVLAGNWSLRDDQAHAWLVERLLRKGQYGAALAHADTLARRRSELWPQTFNLFQSFGSSGPRPFSALASLVATSPPWRAELFTHLVKTPEGLVVASNLAAALQKSSAPVTDDELGQIYTRLINFRMLSAIKAVRTAVGRPPTSDIVVNGSFPIESTAPAPFGWQFMPASGIVADILPDELIDGETALRVQYDGYATPKFADQFIQLDPGAFVLEGAARGESGDAVNRLVWRVICVETDRIITESRSRAWPTTSWSRFQVAFEVPSANCSSQWLRLEPLPSDTRRTMAVWYDKLAIRRASGPIRPVTRDVEPARAE